MLAFLKKREKNEVINFRSARNTVAERYADYLINNRDIKLFLGLGYAPDRTGTLSSISVFGGTNVSTSCSIVWTI